MSINDSFKTFFENIRLTISQKEDAVTKYIGVCQKLHDYYYPEKKYDGRTKLLIGSYGKHTNIRPPRDIDVIFILPTDKFKQYDDNQSNGQSQLLQDVRRILQEKYQDTQIEAWGKVVVLKFTDSKHRVDLLPGWENDDGAFTIPNSENGGTWEHWDTRAEMKRIEDSDNTTKITRSIIRLIKKWSENCTVKLKSFQIENAVLDYLNSNDVINKEYSYIVCDFFRYFKDVCTDRIVKSHLSTAVNRAVKACDYEKDRNLEKASDEWIKIFGDDFPKTYNTTEKSGGLQDRILTLQTNYPSTKEEYLNKNYDIAFKLNPNYHIRIDALISQKGYRQNWLSTFIQNRCFLHKRKKIIFSIVDNNVPEPYGVKWKVRNFGDEAKDSSDLRGEISDDAGSEQKEENTKYYGEHYVECYIIKDGYCVALDKIIVPIGNEYE